MVSFSSLEITSVRANPGKEKGMDGNEKLLMKHVFFLLFFTNQKLNG